MRQPLFHYRRDAARIGAITRYATQRHSYHIRHYRRAISRFSPSDDEGPISTCYFRRVTTAHTIEATTDALPVFAADASSLAGATRRSLDRHASTRLLTTPATHFITPLPTTPTATTVTTASRHRHMMVKADVCELPAALLLLRLSGR
jgi:hypothetical protein